MLWSEMTSKQQKKMEKRIMRARDILDDLRGQGDLMVNVSDMFLDRGMTAALAEKVVREIDDFVACIGGWRNHVEKYLKGGGKR